jgi:hypothetical protein
MCPIMYSKLRPISHVLKVNQVQQKKLKKKKEKFNFYRKISLII